MIFPLGRVVRLCVVFAACAGSVVLYTARPNADQHPSRADMTVIPIGGASAAAFAPTRHAPRKRTLLSGIASWYGDVFDGHRTANGEIYDQGAMTACHKTLPFGTLVRVVNLRNRHSVVVRINDRGILRPERIIDLSSAAAAKLGMLDQGTAPVRLEIVAAANPDASTRQPG